MSRGKRFGAAEIIGKFREARSAWRGWTGGQTGARRDRLTVEAGLPRGGRHLVDRAEELGGGKRSQSTVRERHKDGGQRRDSISPVKPNCG